jgi:hypothetical protein
LHDGIVKVEKVEFPLQRHLVVGIQKVKCEDALRAEHRRWIPTNPQQLSEVFKKSVFGAPAETDRDGVVTGKVNNKQPLSVRGSRTTIAGVA